MFSCFHLLCIPGSHNAQTDLYNAVSLHFHNMEMHIAQHKRLLGGREVSLYLQQETRKSLRIAYISERFLRDISHAAEIGEWNLGIENI